MFKFTYIVYLEHVLQTCGSNSTLVFNDKRQNMQDHEWERVFK